MSDESPQAPCYDWHAVRVSRNMLEQMICLRPDASKPEAQGARCGADRVMSHLSRVFETSSEPAEGDTIDVGHLTKHDEVAVIVKGGGRLALSRAWRS